MSVKISAVVERELRHYHKHEDFGPSSPCLEVLSFGTYELKEPTFPKLADSRIMRRVLKCLSLAEGKEVDGLKLSEEYSFVTKFAEYKQIENPGGYNEIVEVSQGIAGAAPVLSAYYGRYGLDAQQGEGNVHDNTKGYSDSQYAIMAVYPLTGEPMVQRSGQRARDKLDEMSRDRRSATGLRAKLWQNIDRRSQEMLDLAHIAYVEARAVLGG